MFRKILLFVILIFGLSVFVVASAQERKVDYGQQVIVDSDLDGLTDEGERQIFGSDPQKADSDNDNYLDGVEVLSETDPIDQNSFPGFIQKIEAPSEETPWGWYTSRVAGLVAFVLLYISIFLGLTLRIPLLRKIFKPLYAMNVHCWISFQATVLALVHGGALLFDKFFEFSIADLFIPFVSSYNPVLLPMGIVSFCLMIILVVTSYMRGKISHRVWRATHFSNIILYIFVIIHAAGLGTDLKNPTNFYIFLYTNAFLVFLMIVNMQLRIAEAHRLRKVASLAKQANIGPEGV